MANKVPLIAFHNGFKCPMLGLGTFKAEPGQVVQAVKDAIDAGYRHFDCAHIYRNEQEIGTAIKEKIEAGDVKREDLFITSKLWNTYHKKELVEPALKVTLSNMGLDYLDLYLIHWPYAFKEGDDLIPKNEFDEINFSETPFTETWKAMEDCAISGLTKSIGLSNFNSKQIKEILDIAQIKPVANQEASALHRSVYDQIRKAEITPQKSMKMRSKVVECHVYLNQSKLLDFCTEHNITLTAYAPLGSPGRAPETNLGSPLEDLAVTTLASKYKKSPAQILIKFQIQRGVIAIPKSVTKSRIQNNIDIFDFTISDEDMAKLKNLDCNGRLFLVLGNASHKDYPFHIEF